MLHACLMCTDVRHALKLQGMASDIYGPTRHNLMGPPSRWGIIQSRMAPGMHHACLNGRDTSKPRVRGGGRLPWEPDYAPYTRRGCGSVCLGGRGLDDRDCLDCPVVPAPEKEPCRPRVWESARTAPWLSPHKQPSTSLRGCCVAGGLNHACPPSVERRSSQPCIA